MGRCAPGATRRTALVGVLAALSLIFLYAAAFVPTGRLGIVALAGLMPAGAVISAGLPAGAFCYTAAGLLGLLLSPDKGNALLYLVFFGLYPLVKALAERLRPRLLEWLCKLAFFNAVLTFCWFVLRAALLAGLPDFGERVWLLYLAGNAVFAAYDLGFSGVIAFYRTRIEKAVRKG